MGGVHVHSGALTNQTNEKRSSPPGHNLAAVAAAAQQQHKQAQARALQQRNGTGHHPSSRKNHLKHEERSLPMHVPSTVEQNPLRSKKNELKQKANLWASRTVEKKVK